MTISVDLGCGPSPRNPYNCDEVWGIDIGGAYVPASPNVIAWDIIAEPLPFKDSSVDVITAYDFLEHVPRLLYIDSLRKYPFIDLMSEIYRMLVPGGIFRAHTPAYPHPEMFVDPTHVNYITEGTVEYFLPGGLAGRYYGFVGHFELISQHWDEAWPYHLVWELRAIK